MSNISLVMKNAKPRAGAGVFVVCYLDRVLASSYSLPLPWLLVQGVLSDTGGWLGATHALRAHGEAVHRPLVRSSSRLHVPVVREEDVGKRLKEW
jgi:hypothetical protein